MVDAAQHKAGRSALVGLQTGLDGLVVEELLHALLAATLFVEQTRLVEFGVQVILVLLPRSARGNA